MTDDRYALAIELLQRAYELQMQGHLDLAVDLYQQSIRTCPTAEAYTFLGWTYRFQGRIDAAIEECKNAILIDPTFGNPYNDIGAYLIEKHQYEDAAPWLEKAIRCLRYETHHYAWYNLGRVHIALENFTQARQCFQKALEIEPQYPLALQALDQLRKLLQ